MHEQAPEEDELLDLVDDNDNVIGTIQRGENPADMGGYIRAAELLIVNNKGELWIPRRTMHKRISPGGLDFSAAGHVASGDDYLETLHRETEEELNLKLDESKLEFLHKFTPRPDLLPYFRTVYLYRSDDTPQYNPDDFSEAFWIMPAELLQKIRAGEPAKRSLTETIQYLVSKNRA